MIAVSPATHNLYVKLGRGEIVTRTKGTAVWRDADGKIQDAEAIRQLLVNKLAVITKHGLAQERLHAL